MADEQKAKRLEIAHVLFMDIVGYSKLLTDETIRSASGVEPGRAQHRSGREAEAAGALTVLPTGDACVGFLPFGGRAAECAWRLAERCEAAESAGEDGNSQRPIHHVKMQTAREHRRRSINIAQRVMDCGTPANSRE